MLVRSPVEFLTIVARGDPLTRLATLATLSPKGARGT
jgi:hypothetical protein